MKYPEFSVLLRIILLSSSMLVLGLYFLAKFNSLFTRAIKIEWLRKNIVVWLIAICLGLAISPTNRDFFEAAKKGNWVEAITKQVIWITIMSLFVFNATYLITRSKWVRGMTFRKQMVATLSAIIICTMITSVPINYYGNGGSFKNLDLYLLFNFYTGSM